MRLSVIGYLTEMNNKTTLYEVGVLVALTSAGSTSWKKNRGREKAGIFQSTKTGLSE